MWTILCWEWFITITGEIVTELIFFCFFPKVLPVLFKMHTIIFETQLSHANCKENKTVLLGLALSKALGVYHQNKNLLFRERWIARTSRVLEEMIHLQSYLAGCQLCVLFHALKCWSHKCLFWSIFTSLASPHQSGQFTMLSWPPGSAWIFNERIASFLPLPLRYLRYAWMGSRWCRSNGIRLSAQLCLICC